MQDGTSVAIEGAATTKPWYYLRHYHEWRYLELLTLLTVAVMSFNILFATMIDSPFSLWFHDTTILTSMAVGYVLILGILWDLSLILFSMLDDVVIATFNRSIYPKSIGDISRSYRFFPKGLFALPLIFVTCYAILGTSNITLFSFTLLNDLTVWRDDLFWALEEPLFVWLSSFSINTTLWDSLYHSCWLIEVTMLFLLIIIGQNSRFVFLYGFSMVILYYVGRFVGMLNPVKGPAFYKPEYFNHDDGSLTQLAVEKLTTTLSLPAAQAIEHGGILLGGISAMPSLHIGMISLTSYWLYTAHKWTLYVTIPWVMIVWASTIVLGWHYVVDGVGGIVLAFFSIWLTKYFLNLKVSGLSEKI